MKHKSLGQVFTPDWIVEEILNSLDFVEENIPFKKIIDPSCGDGAFLKIIVQKIIDFHLCKKSSIDIIKQNLEECVYGIEIDEIEYNNCINNLNLIVAHKISNEITIDWKVYKGDALKIYKKLVNKFDFVVGNPPYIRIHNLDLSTREILKKNFIFSKGSLDIYISFFELGFKLLNNKGQLGYISANSYLHNSSYLEFRKYLKEKRAIKSITDFKANKIFKNFSTYTAITIINFYEKNNMFLYKELFNNKITILNEIMYKDITHKDWSFSGKENMNFLKELYSNTNKKVSHFYDVQYGFATLRDKIFIGEINNNDDSKNTTKNNNESKNKKLVLFNNHLIERDILYKIVKGSTYRGKKEQIKYIIFPYKKNNGRFNVIPEEEIKEKYPNTYSYLLKNKEELSKRDMDKGSLWYEFGRSQGVQKSYNVKIVLSTLVNGKVHFYKVDKDVFVYSGIFIIKKNETKNFEIIREILSSKEFYKYIQITGKDFSGGYKCITTSQIKDFPTKELNSQKNLNQY